MHLSGAPLQRNLNMINSGMNLMDDLSLSFCFLGEAAYTKNFQRGGQ